MLRLRSTVIFLTAAEVAEVVHRRRFRRYLELDNARIAPYSLAERDQPGVTPLRAVSSQEALEHESTPQTDSGKWATSPPDNRVLPSAEDSPAPPPFDQSVEEDLPPSPELTPRRGRHEQVGDDRHPHTPGSLLLSLRPKRDLSTVATSDGVADLDDSAVLRDSLAMSSTSTPRRASSESSRRMERREAAAPGRASTTELASSHPSRSTDVERAVAPSPPAQPVRDSGGRGDTELDSNAHPSTPHRNSFSGPSVDTRTTPAVSGQARPEDNFSLDTAGVLQARLEAHNAHVGATDFGVQGSQSEITPNTSISRASLAFRVYNDLLPALSQPRTPQNLPEARHQSRLQGSYTAPIRRTSPQPPGTPTTSLARRDIGRRREPSPLGLQTPGFRGLYGGMENVDDSTLFEEIARDLEVGLPRASRPD